MIDLRDYEWHHYIGGNCTLKHRKSQTQPIAWIHHVEQGVYEAWLTRKWEMYSDPVGFSLGIFNACNEALDVINSTLEKAYEDTSTVCRMD